MPVLSCFHFYTAISCLVIACKNKTETRNARQKQEMQDNNMKFVHWNPKNTQDPFSVSIELSNLELNFFSCHPTNPSGKKNKKRFLRPWAALLVSGSLADHRGRFPKIKTKGEAGTWRGLTSSAVPVSPDCLAPHRHTGNGNLPPDRQPALLLVLFLLLLLVVVVIWSQRDGGIVLHLYTRDKGWMADLSSLR